MRPRLALMTAALILVVLTGCDRERPRRDGTRAGATGDIRVAALHHAACMRQRGYQVPDPTFDEQGLPRFEHPDQVAKTQDYLKDQMECSAELRRAYQAAGVPAKASAPPEQFIAFTRCVREQGVVIADPDPVHGLQLEKETLNSPAWPAAAEKCKQHLPPGFEGVAKRPAGGDDK